MPNKRRGTHYEGPLRISNRIMDGLLADVPVQYLTSFTDDIMFFDFALQGALAVADATATIRALASGALNSSMWSYLALGAGPTTNDIVGGGWKLGVNTTSGIGVNLMASNPLARRISLYNDTNTADKDLFFLVEMTTPAIIDDITWSFGLTGKATGPSSTDPLSTSGALNLNTEKIGWHCGAADGWPSMICAGNGGPGTVTDIGGAVEALQGKTTDRVYFGGRVEDHRIFSYYYGTSLAGIKKVGYAQLTEALQFSVAGVTPYMAVHGAGTAGEVIFHKFLCGRINSHE